MIRELIGPKADEFEVSWSNACNRQPLILAAAAFLLMMVPTALAFALDGRTLDDVSVWAKPLKFQFSIAVHLLTLVWLMALLPTEQMQRFATRFSAFVIVAAAAFEISYIVLQAARGEASHFNQSTAFTRTMYGLMGFAAVVMLAASAWIGGLILKHCDRSDARVLSAGLGLMLGSILGAVTGLYMGGQLGHWVGGVLSDQGGVPIFGWSRTGGDLRVAHFVGLHMTQFIPAVGWLAAAEVPGPGARRVVVLAAVAGTSLTAAAFWQALAGSPIVPYSVRGIDASYAEG